MKSKNILISICFIALVTLLASCGQKPLLPLIYEAPFPVIKDRYSPRPLEPWEIKKRASKAPKPKAYIASEHIQVSVGSEGEFTIGKRDGKPLLFCAPDTVGTSATTIRINENNFWNFNYPEVESKISSEQFIRPVAIGDSIVTAWRIELGDRKKIELVQTLTIVARSNEEPFRFRRDAVEIKYTVHNTGIGASDVGLRIMLDTMIGGNDAPLFKISRDGVVQEDVKSEFDTEQQEVPQYWLAFENLPEPTSQTACGTLRGVDFNGPDKFVIASWENIKSQEWGFVSRGISLEEEGSDSAVGLIWNPVTIKPGKPKEFVTFYGLSKVEELPPDKDFTLPNVVVTFDSPMPVRVERRQTQDEPPFLVVNPDTRVITATVNYYSGHDILTDVEVELKPNNPPASIRSIKPDPFVIGQLKPGEKRRVSWSVKMPWKSGEYSFDAVISANIGSEAASVKVIPPIVRVGGFEDDIFKFTVFLEFNSEVVKYVEFDLWFNSTCLRPLTPPDPPAWIIGSGVADMQSIPVPLPSTSAPSAKDTPLAGDYDKGYVYKTAFPEDYKRIKITFERQFDAIGVQVKFPTQVFLKIRPFDNKGGVLLSQTKVEISTP